VRCSHRPLTLVLVFILLMTAAGCAVGSDFRPPPTPDVKGYTENPTPSATVSAPGLAGRAQRLIDGGDIPAQWWVLFQSEALDRLFRRALAESPTLAAAEAALRRAQENLGARTGTVVYPSLDGSFSASRQKIRVLPAVFRMMSGAPSVYSTPL